MESSYLPFSPKTAKTPQIATLTSERPLEPAAMPMFFRFGANQNGRKETKELRRQNSMNTKKTAVKHKRKQRERERERAKRTKLHSARKKGYKARSIRK
jgi:hypothetical protein